MANYFDRYDSPAETPEATPEPRPLQPGPRFDVANAPLPPENVSDIPNTILRGAVEQGLLAPAEGVVRGGAQLGSAIGSEIVRQNILGSEHARLNSTLGALYNAQMMGKSPELTQQIEKVKSRIGEIEAKAAPALAGAASVEYAGTKPLAEGLRSAREAVEEKFPVTPEFQQSFGGMFLTGLAQAAGQLPTYMIPGLGPAMSLGQMYQEGYDDAKSKGADELTAQKAGAANVPAASLDYLADKTVLGRFLHSIKGKMTVGDLLKSTAVSSASEGLTEGAQQMWQNLVANSLVGYDKDRDIDDDVIMSALLGALVGGTVHGVGSGIGAVRAQDLPLPATTTQPVPEERAAAGMSSEQPASAATNALTETQKVDLRKSEELTNDQFWAAFNARQAEMTGVKIPESERRIVGETVTSPIEIDPEEAKVAIDEGQAVLDQWREDNPNAPENITVVFDPNLQHNGYGIRGAFNPKTKEIIVNARYATTPEAVTEVLNHEWAHATISTAEGLSALANFAQQQISAEDLNRVRERYPQRANESNERYKLRLVDEWIAENQEKAPGVMARIVQQIREWLFKISGGKIALTPQQAARVLLRTLREQETGRIQPETEADTATTGEPAQQFALTDTKTPEFKKWFGDSKVVDEEGKPRRVYHGTSVGDDFSTFLTSGFIDGGSHFSEEPAVASHFAKREQSYVGETGGRVLPVYLDIKNPWRVTDLGDWNPNNVLSAWSYQKGIPFSKVIDQYREILRKKDLTSATDAQKIQAFLKAQGHDGIVYLNRVEIYKDGEDRIPEERSSRIFDSRKLSDADFKKAVPEATDSWVAFDPTQIKSATGNVGAYGQRPITAEEAARAGMTEQEANDAQKGGDIRFALTEDQLRKAAMSQRGVPENQMMDSVGAIQDAGGPAVYNDLLEHVGDLSHRLQEPRYQGASAQSKIEKLDRLLNPAPNRMNLEQEIEHGLRSNAEYALVQKYGLEDVRPIWKAYDQVREQHASEIENMIDVARNAMREEGEKYAKAHEDENKPVTYAGRLGRDAAIALGRMDFDALRKISDELKSFYDQHAGSDRIYMTESEAGQGTRFALTQDQIDAIDGKMVRELDIPALRQNGVLSDRYASMLESLIDQFGGDTRIETVPPQFLPDRAAASYNLDDDLIRVSTASKADLGRVILHEYVHGMTLAGLNYAKEFTNYLGETYSAQPRFGVSVRELQDASRRMDDLFDTAKKAAEERGEEFYGLTKVQEFVAEAFSNRKFQKFLSSIPATGTGSKVSLFDKFVSIVRQILGVGDQSLLTDVISATEPLVGAKQKISSTLMADDAVRPNLNEGPEEGEPTRFALSPEKVQQKQMEVVTAQGPFKADSDGFIPTVISEAGALPTVVIGKNKEVAVPFISFNQYANTVFKSKSRDPEFSGKDITLADAHIPVIQEYYSGLSREAYRQKNIEKATDMVVNDMAENLLFLHDLAIKVFGKPVADRMSRWYDGANRIARFLADKYDITLPQSAAVLASLSPQKHWFANVSLAENVMDILKNHQDTTFDRKVEKAAREAVEQSTGTEESKQKLQDLIGEIRGKKLSEITDPREAAVFVRFLSQAIHPRQAYIVTPEGKLTPGSSVAVAWSGTSTTMNAIQAYQNSAIESLTQAIGGGHKVRNFFGNIIDPMNPLFYTSDTHNVAAALMIPAGGSDFEVGHNFGTNPKLVTEEDVRAGKAAVLAEDLPKLPVVGTTVTGLQGTYPLYVEAGRRAAEARDILPRQMQSITWEMIRILFTDDMKTAQFMKDVKAVHGQVRKGRLSLPEVREKIVELSGGTENIKARPPEWLNQ